MKMPIYEEIYRPWQGQLIPEPLTWWVIARTGVRLLWRRAMMLLIMLASIPFLVCTGQIYASTRLGDYPQLAEILKELQIDAGFFAGFLRGQMFFLFLVLILSGAGLIANDRKFRALSIYFSKPVSFWDYMLGKFLVVGFYGSLVTLVPGLLLFLLRVLLAQDSTFLSEFYWIPFALIGQASVILLTLGGMILALSSALKSGRSAGILFFALLFVLDLFRQILSGISGMGLISVPALLRQTNSLFFGLERPFEFSVWLGIAILTTVVGISLLVLKIKLRPTEVVR